MQLKLIVNDNNTMREMILIKIITIYYKKQMNFYLCTLIFEVTLILLISQLFEINLLSSQFPVIVVYFEQWNVPFPLILPFLKFPTSLSPFVSIKVPFPSSLPSKNSPS